MGSIAAKATATTAASAAASEQILQAVFSVCASEEVAAAAMAATESMPGAEFIGQFQEYITAERKPRFPEALKEAAGSVALIDCDRDAELALETMERLQQTFNHHLNLIAITSRIDAEFLVRAMRAGCDDVLHRPVDQELLSTALRRFQKDRRGVAPVSRGTGKVLSFYGVKGGVGTTTMAVHLAMYLVERHRKKVLLIDHKHELGHVTLHLGLKESLYYFDELLRNADRLDADLLDGFVTRHSSGLDVIPSPDTCAPVPDGSPEAIARVLNYLRTRYDFILIDSSLDYNGSFPAISAASDEVALICTPDVSALRDLVRRSSHLTTVQGFGDKMKVVINRSTSDDAVSSDDIVNSLKFPIAVSVPNFYAGLLRALNEGEPVPAQQKNGFTRAILKWADRLASEQATKMTEAKPKKALFRWF